MSSKRKPKKMSPEHILTQRFAVLGPMVLGPEDSDKVQAHLKKCKECQKNYSEFTVPHFLIFGHSIHEEPVKLLAYAARFEFSPQAMGKLSGILKRGDLLDIKMHLPICFGCRKLVTDFRDFLKRIRR